MPPADSEDIRRIIFQGFEKVLTGNKIFLSDEELRRFNEVWSKSLGILPLTIRAAKDIKIQSSFPCLYLKMKLML